MCSFVVFSSDKLPLSDFDKALKNVVIGVQTILIVLLKVVYLGALTVYQ